MKCNGQTNRQNVLCLHFIFLLWQYYFDIVDIGYLNKLLTCLFSDWRTTCLQRPLCHCILR